MMGLQQVLDSLAGQRLFAELGFSRELGKLASYVII